MLEVEKLINNISIEKFLFHIHGVICRFVRGRSNFKEYRTSDDKTRLFFQGRRCPSSNRPATGVKTILFRPPSSPTILEDPTPSIFDPREPSESRNLHFSFGESFSGRGQRVSTIKVPEDCLKARETSRLAKRGFANGWNLNSNRGEDRLENYKRMREDCSISILPLSLRNEGFKKQREQQGAGEESWNGLIEFFSSL